MNLIVKSIGDLPEHQRDAMRRLLQELVRRYGDKAVSIACPYHSLRFCLGALRHAGKLPQEQLDELAKRAVLSLSEIMTMLSAATSADREQIIAVTDALDDFSKDVTDEEMDPINNDRRADAAAVDAAAILAKARAA